MWQLYHRTCVAQCLVGFQVDWSSSLCSCCSCWWWGRLPVGTMTCSDRTWKVVMFVIMIMMIFKMFTNIEAVYINDDLALSSSKDGWWSSTCGWKVWHKILWWWWWVLCWKHDGGDDDDNHMKIMKTSSLLGNMRRRSWSCGSSTSSPLQGRRTFSCQHHDRWRKVGEKTSSSLHNHQKIPVTERPQEIRFLAAASSEKDKTPARLTHLMVLDDHNGD